MNSRIRPEELTTTKRPTVWGLTPTEIHDRYWAACGVHVVRQGEQCDVPKEAKLFLLLNPFLLVLFELGDLIDMLNWLKPKALLIRLRDGQDQGYRERAITDNEDRFLRFERSYGGASSCLTRVALTHDPEIVRLWQGALDQRSGWRELRRRVPPADRAVTTTSGWLYGADVDKDVMQLMRVLVQTWPRPDLTVSRVRKVSSGVWGDQDAHIDPKASFVGPVWVGAGRRLGPEESVLGPSVLWDDPVARPSAEDLCWSRIEPVVPTGIVGTQRRMTRWGRVGKRAFDIVFSSVALLFTLLLYPFIMLAILLEDGRPFFFVHRRETLGGRHFPCLKFRSMRLDAEKIKAQLLKENQVDGPQFFMARDPRLTRVGRFLRKSKLDEIPQFINVLLGHMSVIGPRPSPFSENQFCPAWREARLSVRPGITGLWQVKRTRCAGVDFQEWIKYDIEYVENMSWRLDLWILWRTIGSILGGR